jgi:hypothetical protein
MKKRVGTVKRSLEAIKKESNEKKDLNETLDQEKQRHHTAT